jgi:hypothetical protein
MIVVDSNVIAYCWIHGERTALAHQLRRLDPDWHAPVLWRSELRSILAGYRRDGSLDGEQVGLGGREHHVPSERVFAVLERSRLSAYDSEFVALAEILDVRLVTEDRAILAACADRALSLKRALDVQ